MIGVHIILFFSIGCTKLKTSFQLGLNSVSFRNAFIWYGMAWLLIVPERAQFHEQNYFLRTYPMPAVELCCGWLDSSWPWQLWSGCPHSVALLGSWFWSIILAHNWQANWPCQPGAPVPRHCSQIGMQEYVIVTCYFLRVHHIVLRLGSHPWDAGSLRQSAQTGLLVQNLLLPQA